MWGLVSVVGDGGTNSKLGESSGVYKFKRGAQRDIVHIDPQSTELQGSTRVFSALHGNQYTGPSVNDCTLDSSSTHETVYVDGSGNTYDKNFFPTESGPFGAFHVDPMPRPESYGTFFEYEHALLDWKTAMTERIGGIQLPDVVGHYYARPNVTAHLKELMVTDKGRQAVAALQMSEIFERGEDIPEGAAASGVETGAADRHDSELICLDKDPWDAVLVPAEPQPEQFGTFEEYENAILRWTAVCNRDVRVLPPSAKQLEHLIPLQSQRTIAQAQAARIVRKKDTWAKRSQATDTSGISAPYVPHTTWNMEVQMMKEVGDRWLFNNRTRHQDVHQQYKYGDVVELSEASRANVENIIQVVLQSALMTRIGFHKQYGAFNKPHLPRIHGTLDRSGGHHRSGSVVDEGLASGDLRKLRLNRALRRLDLTDAEKEESHDCPPEIDGRPVEFITSPFEVDVIASRLGDPEYISDLAMEVMRMDQSGRFDHLNGWHHPGKSANHNIHLNSMYSIITKIAEDFVDVGGESTFSVSQLDAILGIPMDLDAFQSTIEVRMPQPGDGMGSQGEEPISTIRHVLVRSISDAPSLSSLLRLYAMHQRNVLYHAKLSYVVDVVVQGPHGKGLLESVVSARDVHSAYMLAYALTFFNPVRVQLYTHDEEVVEGLVLGHASTETRSIIQLTFLSYYLGHVFRAIQETPEAYEATPSAYVGNLRVGVVEELCRLLKAYPKFLREQMMMGIGHRSSRVASVHTFVCTQLMHKDGGVHSLVLSYGRVIMAHLVMLGGSRYSHTQHAVRLLFRLIDEDGDWKEKLYARYHENFGYVLEDSAQHADHCVGVFGRSLIDLFVRDLRRMGEGEDGPDALATKENCMFMLCDQPFTLVYDVIHMTAATPSNGRERGRHGEGGEGISPLLLEFCRLLAEVARTAVRLDRVHVKTRPMGSDGIVCTHHLCMEMLDLVDSIPTDAGALGFQLKAGVLRVLTQLLKPKGAVEVIKRLPLNRIAKYCNERTHSVFCKQAWKLFYQMVKYHNSTMEFLLSSKTMESFINLITAVAGNVVIEHSLHYLNKVFRMQDAALARINAGKRVFTSRGDDASVLKGITKDLKAFTAWFVSLRMFIKIHMIFKRFVENEDGALRFPGRPFVELVRLCETINECGSCEKLRKDTMKHPDYATSLSYIIGMIGKQKAPHYQEAGRHAKGGGMFSTSREGAQQNSKAFRASSAFSLTASMPSVPTFSSASSSTMVYPGAVLSPRGEKKKKKYRGLFKRTKSRRGSKPSATKIEEAV